MFKEKYIFTAEQKAEIEKAKKENNDKRTEKKLKALSLRAERRKKNSEITRYHPICITELVGRYKNGGLEAITGRH